MNREQWETKLDDLFCEVIASKEAYEQLSLTKKLPQKQSFFRQQAEQRREFEKILSHEIVVIKEGGMVKRKKDDACIFDTVAATVNSRNLTAIEVDRLILKKEQELIRKYQDVMEYEDIPEATDALLQSQAEDMNDIAQKLRLELNLEESNF